MKDVTAAVIVQDEKVLITRRAPDEKHAGWWEFPGGKVEDDESPKACLQRELMEELGVEAGIGDLFAESIYTYQTGQAGQVGQGGQASQVGQAGQEGQTGQDGAIRLLAYRAEIKAGEIHLSVHDECQWVRVEDLLQFKLLPADRPIAKKLAAGME